MNLDSLEFDIKYLLLNSPQMRSQWRTLRDGLHTNYEKGYKSKNSFGVVLQRRLNSLCSSGDIEKEVKGHQRVFYLIQEQSRKKVERELNRELAHNALNKIWERLTPEQQKITVERLTEIQQLMVLTVQETFSNVLGLMGELIDGWIGELKNPSESVKHRFSPAQRKQFLREFAELREQCKKKGIDAPVATQALKERLSSRVNLAKDFMEKVVEPDYAGNWDAAVMDLMRKAVEEQRIGRKGHD